METLSMTVDLPWTDMIHIVTMTTYHIYGHDVDRLDKLWKPFLAVKHVLTSKKYCDFCVDHGNLTSGYVNDKGVRYGIA